MLANQLRSDCGIHTAKKESGGSIFDHFVWHAQSSSHTPLLLLIAMCMQKFSVVLILRLLDSFDINLIVFNIQNAHKRLHGHVVAAQFDPTAVENLFEQSRDTDGSGTCHTT